MLFCIFQWNIALICYKLQSACFSPFSNFLPPGPAGAGAWKWFWSRHLDNKCFFPILFNIKLIWQWAGTFDIYESITFRNKVHLSEHESSIVHSSAEWNHYYSYLLLYCFHQSCHFIKWVENSNNLRKQETFSSLGSDIPIWDRVLYKYTMHPLIKTQKLFRPKCINFSEAYAHTK